MELAFFTLLLKDGANSVGGGVAINNKRVFKAGLTKNWSRTNGIDECVEGRFVFEVPVKATAFRAERDKSVERHFVFIIPVEFATFSTVGNKRVEWGGEHAEVMNVHLVEVKKTKECV